MYKLTVCAVTGCALGCVTGIIMLCTGGNTACLVGDFIVVGICLQVGIDGVVKLCRGKGGGWARVWVPVWQVSVCFDLKGGVRLPLVSVRLHACAIPGAQLLSGDQLAVVTQMCCPAE
jgi:hypothetical protein